MITSPKTENTFTADLARKLKIGDVKHFADVSSIDEVRYDNYRGLDKGYVQTLRESIELEGVTNEILIKVFVGKDSISVRCTDGHHRMEAVRLMRVESEADGKPWLYRQLPCKVEAVAEDTGEKRHAIQAVLSNGVRREDTVVEKALGLKRLSDQGFSNTKVGIMMGLDRRSVERLLSILDLPGHVLTLLQSNVLTPTDSVLYSVARQYRLIRDGKKSIDEALPNLVGDVDERIHQALSMKKAVRSTVASKQSLSDMLRSKLERAKYTAKQVDQILAMLP